MTQKGAPTLRHFHLLWFYSCWFSNFPLFLSHEYDYYIQSVYCQIHWLTAEKGVHQFRFFLSTMHTPNSIFVCSCMYAFLLKWVPMRTPPFTGVCIGSHLNRTAFMHEQTTISIHEEEEPKLVYTRFCCKPVNRGYWDALSSNWLVSPCLD